MRFAPTQAEKIWTIIEEGLEEFKKKAAPATEAATASDAQQLPSTNPESITTNGNNVAVETQRDDDHEVEANDNNANGVTVESVLEHALTQSDLAKSTKKTLKKLQKRSDIPLNVQSPKKKKFLKFVQEQLQLDAENGTAVWECLCRSIQMLSPEANGTANASNGKINGRKRKQSGANGATEIENKKAKTEIILADSTTDANGESTFDWQKHILRIFNKGNTNKQISLELLKTKVIRKFLKSVGEDESNSAQYEKKFKKILKKIDSLTITNGVVHQNNE